MNSNIKKLIAEEASASDENRDAPIPSGTSLSRPNRARSAVYSIRLNPEEVASVQALADEAGLPPSTLVRSWIVERVRIEQDDLGDAEAELNAAQRHLSHAKRHLVQR
jgi:predicted DNA-binding protein